MGHSHRSVRHVQHQSMLERRRRDVPESGRAGSETCGSVGAISSIVTFGGAAQSSGSRNLVPSCHRKSRKLSDASSAASSGHASRRSRRTCPASLAIPST